ncbi:MAG: HEAT repeat domain-containing protein [Anaerolineae bacterium]
MMQAIEEFETHKPKEAIPALLDIATGKTTDQLGRRAYAIMALAAIGDPATVQHLTALDAPPELDTVICDALGDIGAPAALPFLQEKVWRSQHLAPRASGMLAQAKIGHPQAIKRLVLEAKDELVNTMYVDYEDNPGGSSGKLGLILLGGAMGIGQALRAAARTASFMGNPELPLQIAAEMPGLVRQMWLFRVRLMALRALAFVCGTGQLSAYRSQAKSSIQQLMIALPLLQLMAPEGGWVNCLAESTRSRHAPERILAYEGYIQLAVKYEDPIYIKWGRAGLYDGKNYVSTAVAASVIYNNVQALVPEALDMARTSSTNKRISLIPPVVELAKSGDPQGLATLKVLMQDRKSAVRNIANAIWKNATGSPH